MFKLISSIWSIIWWGIDFDRRTRLNLLVQNVAGQPTKENSRWRCLNHQVIDVHMHRIYYHFFLLFDIFVLHPVSNELIKFDANPYLLLWINQPNPWEKKSIDRFHSGVEKTNFARISWCYITVNIVVFFTHSFWIYIHRIERFCHSFCHHYFNLYAVCMLTYEIRNILKKKNLT